MNPVLITQIIQAALELAETGSQVYAFLTSVQQRITAAQAAGTDLTAADWSFIDQAAATNLAAAKGYGSLTEALSATPVSTAVASSAPATANGQAPS